MVHKKRKRKVWGEGAWMFRNDVEKDQTFWIQTRKDKLAGLLRKLKLRAAAAKEAMREVRDATSRG